MSRSEGTSPNLNYTTNSGLDPVAQRHGVKVKCDGRPNGCINCENLNLDCLGLSGASLSANTSASRRNSATGPTSRTRAKRTYRSCRSCRAAKSRCTGDRPTCVRCSLRDIQCVYDSAPAPYWARELALEPPESSGNAQEEVVLTPDSAQTSSNDGRHLSEQSAQPQPHERTRIIDPSPYASLGLDKSSWEAVSP